MLRKLIAFAITSGLAKKAWDHFQATRDTGRRPRANVSDVEAKPAARRQGRARKTVRSKPSA